MSSDHGHVEGILEAETGGDGEDGIQTREERAEDEHLPAQRIDRHLRQMKTERSEIFILV